MAFGLGLDLLARLRRGVQYRHPLQRTTGQIQAIIDMGYLSSLRTGAATWCRREIPRPVEHKNVGSDRTRLAATFQVEAIANSCPIKEVAVYGRNPKRRKEFIRQMSKVVKANWKEAETVDEVEAASDILVVSTDSSTPVWLGEPKRRRLGGVYRRKRRS